MFTSRFTALGLLCFTLLAAQGASYALPGRYTVSIAQPSPMAVMADRGQADQSNDTNGCSIGFTAHVTNNQGNVANVLVSFTVQPTNYHVQLNPSAAYTNSEGKVSITATSDQACSAYVRATVTNPDQTTSSADSADVDFVEGDFAWTVSKYSSSGEWRTHQTVQSPPAAASVVGYDEGHIGDGPGTQPSPWISGPLVYDEDVQSLRFSAWASASGSDMTAEAGTVDAAVTLEWSLAWSSSAGCPQPSGFEHSLLTKALAYAGHENEAGSTSVTCSASGGGSASATASASGTSEQCDPGTGQNWPRISSVSVTCPSSGTVTLSQALAASAIRGSGAGTGQTSAWTQYSDLLYTVEPRIVLDHSTSHFHIDGSQPLP